MLLGIRNIFKTSGARTKSIPCSPSRGFSQQDFNSKITIDRNLLYPFSQSQTCKALNSIREASPFLSNYENIFVIDKLTANNYSETYRAYDFDNKTFVAQRNIHLDSPASWNQANLILRLQQQQSPLFARTLSIGYDEKTRNMKITSELQNTILKDYALYHQNTWLKERIRFYARQIIQQLDTLKGLGIELKGEAIDPHKIFIERSIQTLKLYDLSDFIVKDATSRIEQRELLEIAKRTLMEVVDRESKDISEIFLIFKELEAEILRNGTLSEPLPDFVHNLNSCADKGYDQFILEKLLQTAITKESFNMNCNNQQMENDIGRDLGEIYLKHADAFRQKGDFKSATECYEKALEAEANLGKIKERAKPEISNEGFLFEENIYAISKPKTGLEIVINFGINVLLMVFDFFFMFFGGILIIFLLVGAASLLAWGSSQLFGGNDAKNDGEPGVDEK